MSLSVLHSKYFFFFLIKLGNTCQFSFLLENLYNIPRYQIYKLNQIKTDSFVVMYFFLSDLIDGTKLLKKFYLQQLILINSSISYFLLWSSQSGPGLLYIFLSLQTFLFFSFPYFFPIAHPLFHDIYTNYRYTHSVGYFLKHHEKIFLS